MNNYNISVLTNKDLGDPVFVKALLTEWMEIDSKLRPEFFGLGEPVRHSFAEKGIGYAVNIWIKEGMGLLLRRQNDYKYIATIEWFSGDRGLDNRPFPWSCNVSLRRKSGDDLAIKYFKFLVKWFEPAFGYISTDRQIDEKHFIYIEHSRGSTEQYAGLDFEDRIPGIYWVTFFGSPVVERLGKLNITSLRRDDTNVENINNGLLVKAYSSSTEIGSQKASNIESLILEQLGKNHFFDKSLLDFESLLLDDNIDELIIKNT